MPYCVSFSHIFILAYYNHRWSLRCRLSLVANIVIGCRAGFEELCSWAFCQKSQFIWAMFPFTQRVGKKACFFSPVDGAFSFRKRCLNKWMSCIFLPWPERNICLLAESNSDRWIGRQTLSLWASQPRQNCYFIWKQKTLRVKKTSQKYKIVFNDKSFKWNLNILFFWIMDYSFELFLITKPKRGLF